MITSFVTKEAYDTYCLFMAVKRHFQTDEYDYFKYNGKLKLSVKAFDARRDKYQFYKLSKHRDPMGLILSNVHLKPSLWVGDLLEDKSEEQYLAWTKKQQSITFVFNEDLKELLPEFRSNFLVDNGQVPYIVKLYQRRNLELETLCILMKVLKCQDYFSENISDTVIYPDINRLVDKYHPFIEYDRKKIKQIIKQYIQE